ncbi:MAG: prolyl oligopeptidase family serine peptidase [Pyrinomonadaceae bacterium]
MNGINDHLMKFQTLTVILVCLLVSVQAQQSEDFPVPASFRLEGVPRIKNHDVKHLFFEPSAIKSNLIWDVDRTARKLLVTDEKNAIYSVEAPLAKPKLVIDGRVPSTLRVSPTSSLAAFNNDKEDPDNYALFLWDGKSEARKLSSFNGKDDSVDSFIWDRDGKSIYYTLNDYELKTTKLCQSDLSASKCFAVELKGLWNVIDIDSGNILLKYWKSSSNQNVFNYSISNGKLTPLSESGNATKAFFAAGKALILNEDSPECGGNRCLLFIDPRNSKKEIISLQNVRGHLGDVKPSPDGKLLLVQESIDGIDSLWIGKIKSGNVVPAVPSFLNGSYVVWNTRWLSNSEVAFTIENIGQPASIRSFDIRSKKTTAWTTPQLPQSLTGTVKPPETIRWKSFDNKEISGYIVKPTKIEKKSPVLVFIHGGPQVIDRPTFSSLDLRFATFLGLSIVHTNIRGSRGFGNAFLDADNGAKREDAVRDVSSLLDWIANQPDLDADNVFIRGESYGGFVALAAGLRESTRIRGVIAEYPMVSIRNYLKQSWIDEFAISEYGDPKDETLMKKLDELSPLDNAARWKGTPLFLTRGKLDSRVPEGDVLGLKSQLREAGTDVWFIYANEAGHGVSGRFVTAAMYEFIKTHLRRR